MATFALNNDINFSLWHPVLLLFRYLTSIYLLGDLSLVQFVNGFSAGKRGDSDEPLDILTVSGNGIGELQILLATDPRVRRLDVMSVKPLQMHIMRMLTEATPEQIDALWQWAQEQTADYPLLSEAFNSPGLSGFWKQECTKWQAAETCGKLRLLGGRPWDLPEKPTYDLIAMSHAQTLLETRDAKELLTRLKPGGVLGAVMPTEFAPEHGHVFPPRFSDLDVVKNAKAQLRDQAAQRGYDLPPAGQHGRATWTVGEADVFDLASFFIARPLRTLLMGELLIYSLQVDMPDSVRMALLESALEDVPPGHGAGVEVLRIMLAQQAG